LDKYYNLIRMYRILESDTNDLGSTIHFDKRNLDTFGIQVYNLFFMSCNLFEVAAKEMAEKTVEEIVKKKIEEKGMKETRARKEIRNDMSVWTKVSMIRQFSDHELTFIPMDYKFRPLEALGEVDVNDRNPTWWQDYNSVKHDLTQIDKATLRNLIYALCSAGLLVRHVVFIRGVRAIQEQSMLFDSLHLPSI